MPQEFSKKPRKHPSTTCNQHTECLELRRRKKLEWAEAARRRAGRQPKRRRSPIPVDGAPHGTQAGYKKFRCGCPDCVEWSRVSRKGWVERSRRQGGVQAKVADPSRCQGCGVPVMQHDLMRRCG